MNSFETLRRDLQRLCELRQPGNANYNYAISPPLDKAEVRAFETRHGVRLPEDYREFLRGVANGTWSSFGEVFRLGEMDDGFGYAPWNGQSVGDLSAPFPHTQAWNDVPAIVDTDLPEDATDEEEEAYEQAMELAEEPYWDTRNVNGALPISHLGCAIRIWLIVSGPERGNLWLDTRADWGGLKPLEDVSGARLTFYHWYRAWLDEALGSE